MEGKANIQIGHVNNLDKQKVSLTYYTGPFDTVKEAQACKYAMDRVAEAYGAEVHEETTVIGEVDDKAAQVSAIEKTETIEEAAAAPPQETPEEN